MSRKSVNIIIHSLIWTVGFLIVKVYDYLTISYFDYRAYTYFSLILGTVINAIIFYWNSNILLPKVLKKRLKLGNYIIIVVLIVWLLSFLEGISDYVFNKLSNPFWDNVTVELTIEYFDLTLLINFLFLLISFGFGFTKQWHKNEIQKRKLIQDNIQTELNMLKTQIKPHFLFNTLNNIFGIAQKNKESVVASSISKLADIMRYLTYETQKGKIQINKEIDYLENYIELQKLRFSKDDSIEIDFTINGCTKGVFIEQLILLPLVENAFKHGVSLQKETLIKVDLKIEKKHLKFQVKNTVNPLKNKVIKSDSGIGLDNLRKRLDLLYEKKYDLITKNEQNHFEVFLTLEYDKSEN